jgi:hypothetical protein
MNVNEKQLQAIKARREAVGIFVPWKHELSSETGTYWIGDALDVSVVFIDAGVQAEADAVFIANAPTDIDALLVEVESIPWAYIGLILDGRASLKSYDILREWVEKYEPKTIETEVTR